MEVKEEGFFKRQLNERDDINTLLCGKHETSKSQFLLGYVSTKYFTARSLHPAKGSQKEF